MTPVKDLDSLTGDITRDIAIKINDLHTEERIYVMHSVIHGMLEKLMRLGLTKSLPKTYGEEEEEWAYDE